MLSTLLVNYATSTYFLALYSKSFQLNESSLTDSLRRKMAEKINTEKHLSHKHTYLKSVHRYKRSEKFKKFTGNKTEGNFINLYEITARVFDFAYLVYSPLT